MNPTRSLPAGPRPRDAVDLGTVETFAELICADPDLLHSEFDAIIAVIRPAPPATARAVARPPRPEPGRPGDRTTVAQPRAACPERPGHDGCARQRSPPRGG